MGRIMFESFNLELVGAKLNLSQVWWHMPVIQDFGV